MAALNFRDADEFDPETYGDEGAGARIAGQGINGPIVTGLDDRFVEAVNWLRNAKTGDAPGVLSHPELGDRRVDLIFGQRGERGYGIDHIDERHPGELDMLPENWPSMRVAREGPTRISMKNGQAQLAIIPKNFAGDPKNWLLTFYKLDGDRPGGKSFDSASAQDQAVPFPDRPASSIIGQDTQFFNDARRLGSRLMSRMTSGALGGIGPLNLTQAAP
jgi:hypothetical protein